MKAILIGFYLQILTAGLVSSLELGELIPLCSANDPQLNQCVKESGQKLIPIITKGIPELGLLPSDPLVSPEMKLTENNEDIQIEFSFTNVVQLGLSKTRLDDVLVDLKKGLMVFNLTYPVFSFDGSYVAKGSILNFELTGEGKSNVTLQNATGNLVIGFHVEDDRIKEDEVSYGFAFDKIYMNFEHIYFDKSEEMGKLAAAFMNENAAEIMKGFTPALRKYYSNLIRNYLKGFFESTTYSYLFKQA